MIRLLCAAALIVTFSHTAESQTNDVITIQTTSQNQRLVNINMGVSDLYIYWTYQGKVFRSLVDGTFVREFVVAGNPNMIATHNGHIFLTTDNGNQLLKINESTGAQTMISLRNTYRQAITFDRYILFNTYPFDGYILYDMASGVENRLVLPELQFLPNIVYSTVSNLSDEWFYWGATSARRDKDPLLVKTNLQTFETEIVATFYNEDAPAAIARVNDRVYLQVSNNSRLGSELFSVDLAGENRTFVASMGSVASHMLGIVCNDNVVFPRYNPPGHDTLIGLSTINNEVVWEESHTTSELWSYALLTFQQKNSFLIWHNEFGVYAKARPCMN